MTNKTIQQEVQDLLASELTESGPYEQAMSVLREVAKGIEVSLSGGQPGVVQVVLEPGFRVNMGQQYRVRILVPKHNLSDTLFRAYVPMDGFPVTLDLFDEQSPSCPDADSLKRTLLDFLRHRDVRLRFLEIQKLAA